MTPEQISKMALEAGFGAATSLYQRKEIQRFAELVRNATLEEAAKAVDKMANDKKATQQQQFALDLASDLIRSLK